MEFSSMFFCFLSNKRWGATLKLEIEPAEWGVSPMGHWGSELWDSCNGSLI